MKKLEKLYEGKAKVMFATDTPDLLIQYFKDDATAFNGEKRGTISDKGVINNLVTAKLMGILDVVGIPVHLVKVLGSREQLVRKVEIIPIELVVRNVIAGSLAKRLGLPEGEPLPRPLVEFYYKSDALGDPMVSYEHAAIFGWADEDELEGMVEYAHRINDALVAYFAGIDIRLVDYKLEFGRLAGEHEVLVLADEISPDTCRLWDINSGEKLDKDRFRRDLGGVSEAYHEVARRMNVALPQ